MALAGTAEKRKHDQHRPPPVASRARAHLPSGSARCDGWLLKRNLIACLIM